MNTRCVHRLALPSAATLRRAAPLNDARALLFFDEGDGARVEIVDPDGARRVLLRRDTHELSLSAWDTHSGRLVVSVDSAPFVFDLRTEEPLGRLPGVAPTLWELEPAGAGRVMGSSSDGWRRLWDLQTLALVTQRHLRWYKGWSAPVGLLPGDPTLTCLTSMRQGRWVSALVNAHTGRDVGRHHRPARSPAHHAVLPRPGALEWVGVLAEGDERRYAPAQLFHFTQDGARLIDEAPARRLGRERRSAPGIVRLQFITNDWLYTEGARRPHQAIHLPTGARRDCPLVYGPSPSGLVVDHHASTVLDLASGERAALYPGDAPEKGRAVDELSPDGTTALVRTPEGLEWWTLTRRYPSRTSSESQG